MPDDPRTVATRRVNVPANHGHLEAILRDADQPFAAVVVCHPHPLGGGTMNNNVVYRVARALGDAGAAVLRFNFRGVGQSTGLHDNGVGEEDDALAALDFLQEAYPDTELWMAGFSFGARVGLTVGARDPRIQKLVGVGLALKMLDYTFLRETMKPKAFIQGSDDEYGGRDAVQTLFDKLGEPKHLTVVDGATHLFPGHLDELERAAADAVAFLRGL